MEQPLPDVISLMAIKPPGLKLTLSVGAISVHVT